MTFYTIEYLSQRHSWMETVTTIVIAILVAIFAIFAVLYFKNNLKSKYRDLSVMMLHSAAGRILWGSIGLFVGLISLIGVNAMVRNHPKDEFDERI
ncbi:DUF3290 family protein [Weissella confusa]|uniref:DUF3290 family protein n=1 Tax=Weissella confusa TaxID=1583 RepID=UPI0022E89052|nr:DUF3290 family protein [Weissella confusa]